MRYTKQELLNMIEGAKDKMNVFYAEPFINYRGKTADSGEYYSEITAEWILNNLDLFEKISVLTRESYKTAGHHGEIADSPSNREEERIAKEIFNQKSLNILGNIIDYQTPLRSGKTDKKTGKIDLLAYDGATLRILEFKRPESNETMLRCVVEGYTYLKIVNTAKLLESFNLPGNTRVVACPLVFYNKRQHREMLEGRAKLEELIKKWDCKPFYIYNNGEKYVIAEDDI